jgi:deoxycytidylate deaminase
MTKWAANLAVRVAKTSNYPQFKHGAVAVSGGRLLAASTNKFRPFNPKSSCSVHAEVSALRMLFKTNVKFVDLYVARVTNSLVRYSKPCVKCQKFIDDTGIVSRVYYTNNDGKWVSLLRK